MDALLRPEIIGPLSGTAMVVAIVFIIYWSKGRHRELQMHQEMRTREMEHQRRMKELEIEMAKLEVEKARLGQK
jgi:hypothetical protein